MIKQPKLVSHTPKQVEATTKPMSIFPLEKGVATLSNTSKM